ncbi:MULTISPECIES: SGNH/GDSL hydrolase family protein [Gordonia]|uniref:Esterase n=1 Tax=Gordonia alkanivorans CGMCC 6845 TaxID=1423140 RepID=W9DGV5_9ACTN|nr:MULTISPECIES: SGNH/GDSL hydrolase family protein [Gordonia]AZZ82386.1 SGNH/GDSL hydrolase family protein [Gordonia alkanivorans]ETA05495.1 esterase [Gordonia alkanivorans CGMCC 6845]OLT46890.1 esterase [Gordonia sp. CNJ-863]QGP90368.1 SGNH/GDSL hydrolase family protein [Gordonia sp. 135]
MPLPYGRDLRRRLGIRTVLTAAATALALVCGLAHAGGARAADGYPYVNLGDSYSAGASVFPQATNAAMFCSNSLVNYSHLVAERRGLSVADVSCSGASTEDLTQAQHLWQGPQITAVGSATRLITLTIGANNNGLFSFSTSACQQAWLAAPLSATPCRDKFGTSFVDRINSATYPDLVNALRIIKRAAPRARVLLVGYPQIFPAVGSALCSASLLTTPGDTEYLHRAFAALNDAMRRAAAATRATYVDMTKVSAGHDACAGDRRWVEPTLGAVSFPAMHANALGQRAMADQVVAALR